MIKSLRTYIFRQLKVPLNRKEDVKKVLAEELRLSHSVLQNVELERMSLDSRKRGRPHWVCQVRFQV